MDLERPNRAGSGFGNDPAAGGPDLGMVLKGETRRLQTANCREVTAAS
jgi:hypothetical protein